MSWDSVSIRVHAQKRYSVQECYLSSRSHIHQSMGLINEGDARGEGDNRGIRRRREEGGNWRDWGAMRSESGLREAGVIHCLKYEWKGRRDKMTRGRASSSS